MLGSIYTEFKNVFFYFCDTTPVHGFKYLSQKNVGKLERWFWALLIATFIGLMFYYCLTLYIAFYDNITVTTLHDTHYPISNIPLPAVGICSINRLSMKLVTAFINRLTGRFNKTEKWFLRQIRWLGKLYEFNFYGDDQRIELQEIIDEVIADEVTFSDIPSFMGLLNALAVPCDQLILKCYWLGKQHECDEIFKPTITMDGYCCIFNYARPYMYPGNATQENISPKIIINSTEDSKSFNIRTGLKVLIDNNPEEYYYTDILLEGVIVKIFPHDIYPDSAGGEVVDVFCGKGDEVFLNIEASRIEAEEELYLYTKAERGCVKLNEPGISYGTTSLSDCLVSCKIRTVLALCDCVPFTLNFEGNHKVCTILDLSCLHKYKEKLSKLYPSSLKTQELEHEKEDSIKCDCYPACVRTKYKVYENHAALSQVQDYEQAHTFIHIYYGTTTMKLYKTDVVLYWFELLGYIGGLCGIILGFSVISVCEIFYFIVLYLFRVARMCTKRINND